jgi:beta-barrel assembly-enhancing protease
VNSSAWPAAYLDGRTPRRHPATVRVFPTGIEVAVEGAGAVWWPRDEVRQTQGFYAGEQVRLERAAPSTDVVVVDDAALVTALARAWGRPSARLHDPAHRGRRLRLTMLAALGAVGLGASLYFWGIPALADLAAEHVPLAWEEGLGQTVADHLAPPARRCVEPERMKRLDSVLGEVTRALPAHTYRFRLVVVDDDDVNAFAAPGGHLIVLRGLLEFVATPEELAGVFAHEVQHVVRRHTTQALLRHASTGLLLAAAAGDLSGLMAFGLESARTLGSLRYGRRAEEEADREGMRLLIAGGLDPRGMIAFFEALARRESGPSRVGWARYFSSHPATEARLAQLRALAATTTSPPRKLLPDYDWSDMQHICG